MNVYVQKKAEKLRINAIFHFQLRQIGLSWMVRVCVNLTLFGTRPLTSEKTGVFSAALWNHRILLFFLRKDWKVINAQLKSSAPKILFKTDPGQELRFFYSFFLKIIIYSDGLILDKNIILKKRIIFLTRSFASRNLCFSLFTYFLIRLASLRLIISVSKWK